MQMWTLHPNIWQSSINNFCNCFFVKRWSYFYLLWVTVELPQLWIKASFFWQQLSLIVGISKETNNKSETNIRHINKKKQQGLHYELLAFDWVYCLVSLTTPVNRFLDSVTPWRRLQLIFLLSAFAFKELLFITAPDFIQNKECYGSIHVASEKH